MKARKLWQFPIETRPDCIGHSVVLAWWPGRNYVIITYRRDQTTPLAMLTRSLVQRVPYRQTPQPELEKFVTIVNRCDKNGLATTVPGYDPLAEPLYEREYSDLESAKAGHVATVDLIAAGALKL